MRLLPWILLKLDPVCVESRDSGFESVIRRVRSVIGHETAREEMAEELWAQFGPGKSQGNISGNIDPKKATKGKRSTGRKSDNTK